MTTERDQAASTVEGLYGIPGDGHDTPAGRMLLLELFEELGLGALTDEALRRLADLHMSADNRDRFRSAR